MIIYMNKKNFLKIVKETEKTVKKDVLNGPNQIESYYILIGVKVLKTRLLRMFDSNDCNGQITRDDIRKIIIGILEMYLTKSSYKTTNLNRVVEIATYKFRVKGVDVLNTAIEAFFKTEEIKFWEGT